MIKAKIVLPEKKMALRPPKKHLGGEKYKQRRIQIQSRVTRAESCGQVTLHFHSKKVQNNAMGRDMYLQYLHTFLSMPKLLSTSLDTQVVGNLVTFCTRSKQKQIVYIIISFRVQCLRLKPNYFKKQSSSLSFLLTYLW